MPVGRYVLDVHGESEATWPASDAVCAALQIINHIQDCGKDYRNLDRVYIPTDMLAKAGVPYEALGAAEASPALRSVLRELASHTFTLLDDGAVLPKQVQDFRLSLEIGVIIALARHLTRTLQHHDPLSEKVHHSKATFARVAITGALWAAASRFADPGSRFTTAARHP